MKKRKVIAILLAASMTVASVSGCSGKNASSNENAGNQAESSTKESVISVEKTESKVVENKGDEIHVGISTDPVSLAPWVGRSSGMISTYRSIYEYLADIDELGGEMKGCLMKSWEQLDDVTYNLTIYDYIYDTAGNHMTADDVVFSVMSAKNSGNVPKLAVIDQVTAIDDYTAQFTFARALTLGELNAIWSEAPVVTQAAYESSPDGMATKPIGTTAYEVEEYVSGSELHLKNTGKYWQKEELYSPYSYNNYDRIVFHVITESAQRTIALETGTIDVCADIPAEDVSRFNEGGSSSEGMSIATYFDNKVMDLIPNCSSESVCSSLPLRQAIYYAIDAGQVLIGAYGNGKVAYTAASDVYADYVDAWNNEDYYAYNLDLAKEKLEEAGYAPGELTLNLIARNESAFVSAATIVQGFLMAAGINADINIYEGAMFDTVTNDPSGYDLQINTKASTDYVVNVYKLDYDADNFNGRTVNFIEDDELQRLLLEACSIDGHTEESVIAVHNYLKDNAYVYGLCSREGYIVHSDNIATVVFDTRKQVVPGCCIPAN